MNKDTKKYEELLNIYKGQIKSIDNKSSVLIGIISILIASLFSIINILDFWSWITILVLFVITILILLSSLFPYIWSLKYKKNKNNLLHFISISKNYKKDIWDIEISIDDYKNQIFTLCKLIHIKYIMQIISICILALSIILLVIFIPISIFVI